MRLRLASAAPLVATLAAAIVAAAPLAVSASEGEAEETVATETSTFAPLSFRSRIDPGEVRLGDPFTWEVELRHEPGLRYELPRPLELGTLEVRGSRVERRAEGEQAVTTVRILLAVYDALGEVRVPDLVLAARGPGGAGSFAVPGAELRVVATTEGGELADLRGQQPVLRFSWMPIGIGVGLLLAVGAIVAAVRWRGRRGPDALPAEPPRTPEERALDALDALRVEGPLDPAAAASFYFRLSEILRAYLEATTGLPALEMTSAELLAAIGRREVPGLDADRLAGWLERGDLHRFARAAAEPERAEADRREAREIVEAIAAARARAQGPGEEAA